MKLFSFLIASAALVGLSVALDGCPNFPIPLGPNDGTTRVGSNACVQILKNQVPDWFNPAWHTAGIEVRNFNTSDPNENAFPLPVDTENTCDGTGTSFVLATSGSGRTAVGKPAPGSDGCSILIKLGGQSTEDVIVTWGVI